MVARSLIALVVLVMLGLSLIVPAGVVNASVANPVAVQANSQGAISILGITFPPLVVCGNEGLPECSFYDVFTVFKNLITTMFYLCIPIVFFMLAYAAFLYLTAGDSEQGHEAAKNILTYSAWGFFWMCFAWLLVRAILEPLLNTASGFKILGL